MTKKKCDHSCGCKKIATVNLAKLMNMHPMISGKDLNRCQDCINNKCQKVIRFF